MLKCPVAYLGLELINNHTCHQKPNPSRETVPLNPYIIMLVNVGFPIFKTLSLNLGG
jgi:hypothetical protein